MRICVLTVNHGTSAYAELLLESLLHHHPGRDNLTVVVLDNQSDELDRLDRFRAAGVEIRQSGYSTTAGLTTHGEILRDAILAAGEGDEFDAYLLVDCDVCFVADGTIDELARELEADRGAFAVQARWLTPDGSDFTGGADADRPVSLVRESLRSLPDGEWSAPFEFAVELQLDDRVHPFCALIRNTPAFRATVENLGLSPAMVQCERGGKWWDTLGLLTQVMKTHGLTFRSSGQGVIHFGNVSWDPQWAAEKAAARDALLAKYTTV
ncbi:MAG TPA: hypothetical protein VFG33_30445 [Kribbella sp.]|uniref:hypothetical protein n=1 Tax=Kribbella sp. TaxID=1871183 RepID=UPI002D76DAE8|nr:hypothetical protein [Kribbella sp.]HET6297744.1 hypothetical protein [Kribbella sp.]